MSVNFYLTTVIIKAIAPENYKPRTSTYRIVCVSDKKSYQKVAEERALNKVKTALESQNPNVDLQYKATSSIESITCCMSDVDTVL